MWNKFKIFPHEYKRQRYLRQLSDVVHRTLYLIIGGEEVHEPGLDAGFLDDVDNGSTTLLSLQGGQHFQQELQSQAIFYLVFLEEEEDEELPNAH